MPRINRTPLLPALALALAALGCDSLLGLDEFASATTLSAGGAGGAAGAGAAGAVGGTGGVGGAAQGGGGQGGTLPLAVTWLKGFGRSGSEGATAVDDAAGPVVVGHFPSEIEFGADFYSSEGNYDGFVAQLDANGAPQWSQHFGGTGEGRLRAVARASEHHFTAGIFNGSFTIGGDPYIVTNPWSMFIASHATDGQVEWSHAFSAADERGTQLRAAAVDSGGHPVIVGSKNASVDFGHGAKPHYAAAGVSDIFVAKRDGASGGALWDGAFGSTGNDDAHAVAVRSDNSILVGGTCAGQSFEFFATTLATAGGGDACLLEVTSAGDQGALAVAWGDGALQRITAVAVASDGDIVIAGDFDGTIDLGGGPQADGGATSLFVARLQANGAHRWSTFISCAKPCQANGMDVDDTSIVLGGGFEGEADFGGGSVAAVGSDQDLFLLELDRNGGYRNALSAGNPAGGSAVTALRFAPDGTLWVVGRFKDEITFGDRTVKSFGSSTDIFVAKLRR